MKLLGVICAALTLLGQPAMATELRYDAFMGGSRAGQAVVQLSLDDIGYSISGRAKAQGLLAAFGDWRTNFRASGLIADAQKTLTEYHYTERATDKHRQVTVQDGTVSIVKNGRKRAKRPALPGMDVLTALFVNPTCDNSFQLHTGRHGYRLDKNQEKVAGGNTCQYRVTDRDGDHFALDVRFTHVDGLRVPESLIIIGALQGRMVLVRP